MYRKIVQKNLERPFLAIPNLYWSFWEKLSEKIQNSHFWLFQIYTSLFGKNCQKNLKQPFLAILNFFSIVRLSKVSHVNICQLTLTYPLIDFKLPILKKSTQLVHLVSFGYELLLKMV